MSLPRDPESWAHALNEMRAVLEPEGWKVFRSRRGLKARWRWYRLSLHYKPKGDPESPWRARLRDRFPPTLLAEQRGADPKAALRPVVAEARTAAAFCEGRLGLALNPSKGWLAHHLWSAVHPEPAAGRRRTSGSGGSR